MWHQIYRPHFALLAFVYQSIAPCSARIIDLPPMTSY